jgi:uncharacterized protein YbaR (Trm112 family)
LAAVTLLSAALCPACRGELDVGSDDEPIACSGCGLSYPRIGGLPVLLPSADQHLALWRGQLALLLEQGRRTQAALADAAGAPERAPATRERLIALGQAVRDQVDDFACVIGEGLGGHGPSATPGSALPRGVVEYSGYLYRDWGWPTAGYRENEAPLRELGHVIGERPLGRTLVLGAGACGLAYELHLRHGASETVAVDIDPFLLLIAERVVRGRSVRLTEASLKWIEASQVSRRWTLTAGSGTLGREVFWCVFADGVAPPFRQASFDSVVTPWFIDQVPRDLPSFFATVHGLLRPGGRWLNQGPLVYPESTPFEERYAREELFELARGAGFTLNGWSRVSLPYLVSPLSGNGKIESVLSFVAAC